MRPLRGRVRAVRPWHVVVLQWAVNTAGTLLLIAEYTWLLPLEPAAREPGTVRMNVLLGLGFLVFSWVFVLLVNAPRTHKALDWTAEGREPTPRERDLTLTLPWFWFKMAIILWGLPDVVVTAVNLPIAPWSALLMAGEILAVGAAVAATAFLLTQRLLREATHTVLELIPPEPGATAGVGERAVFFWALTTGLPLLGFVMLVAFAPVTEPSMQRIALTGLLIGGPVVVVGFLTNILFAKSIGRPLTDLTHAMRDVESGNLDLHLHVNEWGEIGELQAGMNRMLVALREREQLQDLFGRHVGADVARQALRHGVELGGEEVEAAALFVDVIGSTTMAVQRSPAEVVMALNRFFEVVVDVVAAHGGLVNKFEGDAALCIFGAPLKLDDAAGAALAAAREMAQRLRAEVTELEAGIGVSHGLVIAGNIGATQRLEYTVIGDPVNEAARLTELSKQRPERLVASQRIVARADDAERKHWALLAPVVLRGRSTATVLAVPA